MGHLKEFQKYLRRQKIVKCGLGKNTLILISQMNGWMDSELSITSQDHHPGILKASFGERKRCDSSEAGGHSPHQLTLLGKPHIANSIAPEPSSFKGRTRQVFFFKKKNMAPLLSYWEATEQALTSQPGCNRCL